MRSSLARYLAVFLRMKHTTARQVIGSMPTTSSVIYPGDGNPSYTPGMEDIPPLPTFSQQHRLNEPNQGVTWQIMWLRKIYLQESFPNLSAFAPPCCLRGREEAGAGTTIPYPRRVVLYSSPSLPSFSTTERDTRLEASTATVATEVAAGQ